MSNVETNLIKPFPVAFSGHTLKYEIECICKIFLPMRKFTFLYDTTQLPADAEEGAVLILEQLGEQSRFWVQVQYRGQVMEQEQQFPACSPETEKQLCEYRFSAMLFRLLEEITDLHPAWGLLTGIRPVKKVQPLLGQGLSKAEVCEKLHEKYWIAPESCRWSMIQQWCSSRFWKKHRSTASVCMCRFRFVLHGAAIVLLCPIPLHRLRI